MIMSGNPQPPVTGGGNAGFAVRHSTVFITGMPERNIQNQTVAREMLGTTGCAVMPKCASCKEPTSNRFGLTYACNHEHALAVIRARQERKERKALAAARSKARADKLRIKPRSQWMREAQQAFNAYIRARDFDKPCICCGRFGTSDQLTGGEWDCGHYRSVGSCPELRFDEDNAHRQLKSCNRFFSGRAVDYRIGIIARIGVERVERLEGPHEPRKYTVDELKALIVEYRAKRRELERGR